jgi:hypothetical protein
MLPFSLSFLSFLISCFYYSLFSDALTSQDWLNINGFTKIVVPDTFLYSDVVNGSDDIFKSLIESSVKNTVGPSILWFFAKGSWILTLLFNSIQLFFTLLYVSKLAILLNVKKQKTRIIMFVLALMPATIYHSIGALKEIPTMLFVTGFFYHYLRKEKKQCLLYTAIGVVFRSQLGLILGIFFCADVLHKRFRLSHLTCALSILLLISAIYPFIKVDFFGSESSYLYREEYISASGGSIGGIVEFIRGSVPIASIFAILFRIFQSITEPILTLLVQHSFLEDNYISMILVVYFLSFLLCMSSWSNLLKGITITLMTKDSYYVDDNLMKLYTICLSFVFPVGGFSFIHHRYLYPITALLLIAGTVRVEKSKKIENL